MSATERLRALLDERGVEHDDFLDVTFWNDSDGDSYTASEIYTSGNKKPSTKRLMLRRTVTPEQAVEATVGRGTCHKVRVHEVIEDEMCCSECGRFLGFAGDIGAPPYNYCPNCGRKVVD